MTEVRTSHRLAPEIEVTRLGPGRFTTVAGQEWCNPGGGLWGGYALGLAIRVLEAEPEAVGEALSLTATYAGRLPFGPLDVRTRCLRQGGSIGVWEVELRSEGSEAVGVHVIATVARRPETPSFAFATMPRAPLPEDLPAPESPMSAMHMAGSAFERRSLEGFPPEPGGDSRSIAWMRSRHAPLDKALLAMITDNSPPRSMYALGRTIMSTTLTLTVYLHATVEEIAAVGTDYILVECEGRVGGRGASDERSSYWTRDGRLLATSDQLAWFRELRPQSPE